ncbi:MAG: ATP-binding protein [Candidatus Peribacteria bacterium]|nr:ATP-binding protein [Candidatus Peribacteria bacterium]
MENIVAIELFRREKEFYYYLEGKRECDFLVKDHTSQPIQEAIQVTWELNFSSETREIEGLIEAMKKCHLSEGFILTYNQKKELNVEGYQIHMLPLLERLR